MSWGPNFNSHQGGGSWFEPNYVQNPNNVSYPLNRQNFQAFSYTSNVSPMIRPQNNQLNSFQNYQLQQGMQNMPNSNHNQQQGMQNMPNSNHNQQRSMPIQDHNQQQPPDWSWPPVESANSPQSDYNRSISQQNDAKDDMNYENQSADKLWSNQYLHETAPNSYRSSYPVSQHNSNTRPYGMKSQNQISPKPLAENPKNQNRSFGSRGQVGNRGLAQQRNTYNNCYNNCPICGDMVLLQDWIQHATSHGNPTTKQKPENDSSPTFSATYEASQIRKRPNSSYEPEFRQFESDQHNRAEGHLMLDELLKAAETRPYLLQQFSCYICSERNMSFEELLSHTQTVKHMHKIFNWINDVTNPGYDKYKICLKVVSWPETSIAKHFDEHHHIRKLQWFREHLQWVTKGHAIKRQRGEMSQTPPRAHSRQEISPNKARQYDYRSPVQAEGTTSYHKLQEIVSSLRSSSIYKSRSPELDYKWSSHDKMRTSSRDAVPNDFYATTPTKEDILSMLKAPTNDRMFKDKPENSRSLDHYGKKSVDESIGEKILNEWLDSEPSQQFNRKSPESRRYRPDYQQPLSPRISYRSITPPRRQMSPKRNHHSSERFHQDHKSRSKRSRSPREKSRYTSHRKVSRREERTPPRRTSLDKQSLTDGQQSRKPRYSSPIRSKKEEPVSVTRRRLSPVVLDAKDREHLTKKIENTWQRYYHKYYSCVTTNPEIVLELQKEYLRSYRGFFKDDPCFEYYYVKVAKPEDLREALTLRIDRGSPGPNPNDLDYSISKANTECPPKASKRAEKELPKVNVQSDVKPDKHFDGEPTIKMNEERGKDNRESFKVKSGANVKSATTSLKGKDDHLDENIPANARVEREQTVKQDNDRDPVTKSKASVKDQNEQAEVRRIAEQLLIAANKTKRVTLPPPLKSDSQDIKQDSKGSSNKQATTDELKEIQTDQFKEKSNIQKPNIFVDTKEQPKNPSEDRFQEKTSGNHSLITEPVITSTTQGFPIDKRNTESKAKSVKDRLGAQRERSRDRETRFKSTSGEHHRSRSNEYNSRDRGARDKTKDSRRRDRQSDNSKYHRVHNSESQYSHESESDLPQMFADPFLAFVHKTLTGIILIGQYQKEMAQGNNTAIVKEGINKEQKEMHSRMTTNDGHLLIRLARCCVSEPNEMERAFPNVHKDVFPILQNLDSQIISLIADTPIIFP